MADQESTSVSILVMEPLPLMRLGLIAAAGHGREVATVDELHLCTRAEAGRTVLLLAIVGDPDWDILDVARRTPSLRTIVLQETYSEAMAIRALRAGAAWVLKREATADQLRRAIDQVVAGDITVPLSSLHASLARPATALPSLPDEEIRWLRALSRGTTIAVVAEASALSERALYRRLKIVYRRLGVNTRTEAVLLARTEGWL